MATTAAAAPIVVPTEGDDRRLSDVSSGSGSARSEGSGAAGAGAGAGAGATTAAAPSPTAASPPSPGTEGSPATAAEADAAAGAEESKGVDKEVSGADESKAGLTVYEEETLEFTVTSVLLGETRTNKDVKGDFTEYSLDTVRTTATGEEKKATVWHRYSSFLVTHAALAAAGHTFEFPGKKWFGNLDPAFISERKSRLQAFVQAVLATPAARDSDEFKAFVLPGARPDWPAQVGAINLAVHDCPHRSSATEWWYYNTHLTTASGRELSAFVCFFRLIKHVDKQGRKYYGHALNVAITDVENERYVSNVLLDRDAPKVIKETLESGVFKDSRLRRAMMEVLDKGNVPLPDRMFTVEPKVSWTSLDIDMEEASVTKDKAGAYIINASLPAGRGGKNGLKLSFAPRKAPVRHGLNGTVKGHNGDDMFYYFIPRCSVKGTITLDGEDLAVTGDGWYDHEFGGSREEGTAVNHTYGWNWAAVQLGNGWEITGAVLKDIRTTPHRLMETRVVMVGPDGERVPANDLGLEPLNEWRSLRTFSSYPTEWQLTVPSKGVNLRLKATFDDQEFVTLISHPGFWEGRMEVAGTFQGAEVTGKAFFERNGFDALKTLGGFFGNVGKLVRNAVTEAYPMPPTRKQATLLVATKDTEHWMDGVPLDKLSDNLIKPFRVIADRGGKSWRSYGALACVDVVGGDSRNFFNWLAMPEFMHVGSLIVDDIQDKSETRRGGPCSHLMFGEPICINAGTAAYFQFQTIMGDMPLSDKDMVRIYDLYFQALRAGHAGQALDIGGLDYLMDELVATGDAAVAEQRILAIHLLKTAAPACVLAKMGAVAGGGSEEQISAIGDYFEAIGVAFQIMDDVLNLRGLYTNEADRKANIVLKKIGEDIMCGKVTIPVVKAMGVLDTVEKRQALWDVVRSKPQDPDVVAQVIQDLEDIGAVDACVKQATDIVEEKWRILDACTDDSFAKVMLRSFGWFVIDRSK